MIKPLLKPSQQPRKRKKNHSKMRECDFCGKSYVIERWPRTKCCSVECSNSLRAKAVQVTRKCRGCGIEYTASRCHPNVFCSQECFFQSRRRSLVCKQCGNDFEVRAHTVGVRKYCSPRCSADATIANLPIVNCLHCGKARRSAASTRKRKFCSTKCARLHNVGPNNPQWRGQRHHERGVTWGKQRDLARKRDEHACQHCGRASVKKQKVSVDHIIPYRLALQYSQGNPLYDPNNLFNLICLCRACHSTKTMMEKRLLDGDVMGFVQEVKRIVPAARLVEAMRYSQLPIPEYLTA